MDHINHSNMDHTHHMHNTMAPPTGTTHDHGGGNDGGGNDGGHGGHMSMVSDSNLTTESHDPQM